MMFWEEQIGDDIEESLGLPYRVDSYGARTIRGGDSTTFHGSLIAARVAAFFAALRGDERVVVVTVRLVQ